MRISAIIPFVFFILCVLTCQTQIAYHWAHSVGGTGNDGGGKVAHDANGNLFVTGSYFGSTITIGGFTLNNTNNGGNYILKYNPAGDLMWVFSPSGPGRAGFNYISCDAEGNVVTGGVFSGTSVALGSVVLTNSSTNNTSTDVYAVKLDTDGNVLWAKSAQADGSEDGGACTDMAGNVFLTGNFASSTITVGSETLSLSPASSLEQIDIFMSKFDSDGNFLWANSIGGGAGDRGFNLTADISGNVFLNGTFFSDTLIAGNDTLLNSSIVELNSIDILLVKYNSNGDVEWARSAQGSESDLSYGLACDSDGNVINGGGFSSSTLSFDNVVLNNSGSSDMFLAKYNSMGDLLWANSYGGIGFEYVRNISTNSNNDILFGSELLGNETLSIGSTTLQGNGDYDFVLCKLDASGNPYWAGVYGGIHEERIGGLSLQNDDGINIGGSFKSPSLNMEDIILTNAGNITTDLFVAKSETSTDIEKRIGSQKQLLIFPNPSMHTINISNLPAGKSPVVIRDISGRIVKTTNLDSATPQLDIKDLLSGTYIIEIASDHHSYSGRFSKI